jgi:NAD(P)-dependent dehydrogenase (short-subunit alcohol dehydrogenase family)
MNDSLNGKVALVTGGTKGIGKAIAHKLSSAGAQVVITARTPPQDANVSHHFIASDLSNAESTTDLANKILEEYGRVDIIVNNAGANTSPGGGYSTLTDENWENEMQMNLMSAVRINKILLPTMIERKSGVIIHVSSGAAVLPLWDMTMSYSASKAALNAYSKALANELAPKGVRVLTVSPGMVRTPLMMEFIENLAKSNNITVDEMTKSLIGQIGIPIGRMSEPEDVANLVGFLVSSEAQYLTAANYLVDGGIVPVV